MCDGLRPVRHPRRYTVRIRKLLALVTLGLGLALTSQTASADRLCVQIDPPGNTSSAAASYPDIDDPICVPLP